MNEQYDVKAFHEKFGVTMSSQPALMGPELFHFRFRFLMEELKEFFDAHVDGDIEKAADALVDLAYVLHGTALIMGLPWEQLWNEVQRANMQKERAVSKSQSKRGSAFDVIKPPGWTPPDHMPALGSGPWPTFEGK